MFRSQPGVKWRLDLVHVQREAPHLDTHACELREPCAVVACHVDAVGIVVAEVQHDRRLVIAHDETDVVATGDEVTNEHDGSDGLVFGTELREDAIALPSGLLEVSRLEGETQTLRGRSLVDGDLAPPHWTVPKQVVVGVAVSRSTGDPNRDVCSLAHGYVLRRFGEASEPRRPLVGPGVREAGDFFQP